MSLIGRRYFANARQLRRHDQEHGGTSYTKRHLVRPQGLGISGSPTP